MFAPTKGYANQGKRFFHTDRIFDPRFPDSSVNYVLMTRVLFAFFVALFVSGPARAYTEAELSLEFDARQLTADEKRFLQAALAFMGSYTGMIDGAWGQGSQDALERYVASTGGEPDIVPNWAAALLAGSTAQAFSRGGWEERYFDEFDMSLLVPVGHLRDGPPSDLVVNLNHQDSSLAYSFSRGNGDQMSGFHEYALGQHVAGNAPYLIRKEGVWITSTRVSSDISLYVRSDLRGSLWSTVMVSANDRDKGLLAAVTGSIRQGYAPPIALPNGELSRGYVAIQDIIAGEAYVDRPSATATPTAEASAPANRGHEAGTGTGFVVSSEGYILTNAHVVTDCYAITTDGAPATLVALDAKLDLALLKSSPPSGVTAARFASSPALLNSDITVVGFPLAGLLGGLNVTRGSLTSQKGLAGDTMTMQISAPVQPGNSGGPVLNAAGQVVGVVVSKLDAKFVANAIGDIPQNVNFAIRGEIAKLFLFQNNVQPEVSSSAEVLSPEAIAQAATTFTKFVSCE